MSIEEAENYIKLNNCETIIHKIKLQEEKDLNIEDKSVEDDVSFVSSDY